MNHTMQVENRGSERVGNFDRIVVFNFGDKVDMLKWGGDTEPYMPKDYTVAIFKIKWKNK